MGPIIAIKQQPSALYLTWVLNNICTNHCAYCPADLHQGQNHHYEWSHAESFSQYIIDRHPRIQLAISGGEPTLSPWFADLVKMYSLAGHPVGVTTNGARSIRYFEEIAPYLSYVVMSFHPSYEDPEFLAKALACARSTHTTVSVMMDSRYFDRALDMFNQLSQHPELGVNHVRIQDWRARTYTGSEYTPEQHLFMDSMPRVHRRRSPQVRNPSVMGARTFDASGLSKALDAQQLINQKATDFSGWSCSIGLESLFVRYDGGIRSGNCHSAPELGRIQDLASIKWPTEPIICPQNYCDCATDVYVSKQRI